MEKKEKEKTRVIRLTISKVLTYKHEYFFRIICNDFNEGIWLELPKDGVLPKRDSKQGDKIATDCREKLIKSINEFIASSEEPFPVAPYGLEVCDVRAQFENETKICGAFGISSRERKMCRLNYMDCVMKVDDPNEILFFHSIISNIAS